MPQAIAFAVAFVVSNAAAVLGASVATQAILAGAIVSGFGTAVIGVGLAIGAAYLATSLAQQRNAPSQPIPRPEDGKYNLKQNVPALTFVYGRVKKAGDYVFLEESGGRAYHVIVHAAHRIEGFVTHYLNDDVATLNGEGYVTSVASEDDGSSRYYKIGSSYKVRILERLGLNLETAYSQIVSAFPTIWTDDHRGDSLASIYMHCDSVSANDYTTVYPHGMPSHSAVQDGKLIYDPRTETTVFSTNLALIRLDYLLAPYGGRLSLADVDIDTWKNAADVCDQDVLNREAQSEKRYHGGLWARYSNAPVEIGRSIDQASELVLYENAAGQIAVHAGEWVEPDIHLERKHIHSFSFQANRDPSSHVLAIRGRYTDPDSDYNTVDAALYGAAYIDDEDDRSRTLDNVVVQSHNHIQRLQKISYLRNRAPRVTITCDYFAAINLPFRRFVKVTKAPQLNGAFVEIVGKPTLDLINMRYEFEGIVVPASLFDFDAATEEGTPGNSPTVIGSEGVPDVSNFNVTIQTKDISGGTVSAFALATFTRASDALIYELEYSKTSGGTTETTDAADGEDEVESGILTDNIEYQFRMRARDALNSFGDWTSYITLTAQADAVAPDPPTAVDATGGAGQATIDFTTPNSANFSSARIYRNTTNDFGTASLVTAVFASPSVVQNYVDTSLSADDYYYWVTAANGSGVESAEVAAASNPATVT